MGKSSPTAPTPIIVNPNQSATQQATFNEDAARKQRALNMIDQYAPEGSLTYQDTGFDIEGIPQMAMIKSLSPTQQALFDSSNRVGLKFGDIAESQLSKVQGMYSSPFDFGAIGPSLSAPDLSSAGAVPVANEETRIASRQAILARMQPQLDRDKSALETQLAGQGLVTGTEAYNTAMGEHLRRVNDMYLGADAQSGNEMSRIFGMQGQTYQQKLSDLSAQYGLSGNARDRAINELLMKRNQPMNELASFMSGSQASMPSFVPTPQGSIGAPDFMGAQFANANIRNTANQNAFNQQQSQYNANLQGLYGLGGAAASSFAWSDRLLKKNIKQVGVLDNGLNVYTYNYIGSDDPQVGLMADEVGEVHPEAVQRFGGYLAVDYSLAVV